MEVKWNKKCLAPRDNELTTRTMGTWKKSRMETRLADRPEPDRHAEPQHTIPRARPHSKRSPCVTPAVWLGEQLFHKSSPAHRWKAWTQIWRLSTYCVGTNEPIVSEQSWDQTCVTSSPDCSVDNRSKGRETEAGKWSDSRDLSQRLDGSTEGGKQLWKNPDPEKINCFRLPARLHEDVNVFFT